jgi:ribosomal protein S18 acetylase RimI-like enzyme
VRTVFAATPRETAEQSRPVPQLAYSHAAYAAWPGAAAGSALFRAAEGWAGARGCGWLKIETQNVNAAACRFYRKMGCALGGIDRFAYPELPDEVQLLWWKALASCYERRPG